MSELKFKVCGMKDPDNIRKLIDLRPNFIGFIFYKKSPRFIGEGDEELMSRIPISIKKVGVFVNETVENIVSAYKKYGLDYVQLHGDEDLNFTRELKEKGLGIIKVFRILDSLPYSMAEFSEVSDYFLFDTASAYYGGSGRHFDWSILSSYKLDTPFLLSGGIGLKDIEDVKKLEVNGIAGVDVNSRFELEPGLKNIELVQKLKEML